MKTKLAIALAASLGICTVASTPYAAEVPVENRELSQRDQRTLKEIIDSIRRVVSPSAASPIASTISSNPRHVSEKQKEGFRETEFVLPYGITVGALVKISDPSAPYIISSNGFLTDTSFFSDTGTGAYAVGNFLGVAQKYLQEYNLVILDHPTSSTFIAANGEPSFGGIEGGDISTKVAEQLKADGATSVHLVGVSMGGLDALHAAFRGKGTIDSVIAISAVTDPLDIPAGALRAVTPSGACGKLYRNGSTLNTAIGLGILLKPLLHTLSEYSDASVADICDFFFQTERYQDESYMRELYAPYIAQKILPDRLPKNTVEYLAQSNASLIAPHIEVPVFLIYAKGDPAVSRVHYDNFMLAATGNDFVQGNIYRHGGHNGFSAAYGKRWVGCVIQTNVDYWSAEHVTFDKECF